ncbi:hypothetical protein AAGO42_25300, partial [Klebsiella pneumoniae]
MAEEKRPVLSLKRKPAAESTGTDVRTTAAWRLQIENRPGSSCCCRTPR